MATKSVERPKEAVVKKDDVAMISLVELREMSKAVEEAVNRYISVPGFANGRQVTRNLEEGNYTNVSFFLEEERLGYRKDIYCAFSDKALEKFNPGAENMLWEGKEIRVYGKISERSSRIGFVVIEVEDFEL